jgi:hypothetical protein
VASLITSSRFWAAIWIFWLLLITPAVSKEQSRALCSQPLPDEKVIDLFKQNAMKQLALEFGDKGIFVYELEATPVDNVLVRMSGYAKYPRPGQKDLATMRIKGWISRCTGTTIVRGNTWLADGTLKVPRYTAEQLVGRGLQWGNPQAPLRFIVYLDSRCPHCHRLITYAKPLVEQGKVFVDLRQVAYLENTQEAVNDTRLWQTSLVKRDGATLSDNEYLELLGGFANEEDVADRSAAYNKAIDLIETNTATAKKVLHIVTVPGVLVQEQSHQGQYRRMGYWEINRIFQ